MTTPENPTNTNPSSEEVAANIDNQSSDNFPLEDDPFQPLADVDFFPPDLEPEVAAEKDTKELPIQHVETAVSPFKENYDKNKLSIPLPSDTHEGLADMISSLPMVDIADDDEWAETIRDSQTAEVFNGTGYARFSGDVDFTNLIKTEGELPLTGLYAGSDRQTNTELTGERAVLSIMNYLKVGNIFMVPLWNSGFWVSIKPPTEGELIDLMHTIRAEKVRIGRATYGLAYSSITGVTAKHVIEFIKAHIYSTSINSKEININEIDKHISVNDMDCLINAIISTQYPDGFNYTRSCTVDPVKCNYVVKGSIDPSKLLYVNRRALTPSMVSHMANRRANKMSMKDVESYQVQLASRNIRLMSHVFDGRQIDFELKTPTISNLIENTDTWVSSIEETTDKILAHDATERQRIDLVQQHAKATTMRQYGHYVVQISYGEGQVIKSRSAIYGVLNALSSNDELGATFNKNVTDLVNYSTIASIGIPTYKCPNCNKKVTSHQNRDEAYESIIPLDMLSIFFDLVRVRMAQIGQR